MLFINVNACNTLKIKWTIWTGCFVSVVVCGLRLVVVVTGIVGFLFEPRKQGETGVPNPSLKSLLNAEHLYFVFGLVRFSCRSQLFEGRLALNFYPGFYFLQALSLIIFSILFRASNHQTVDEELNWISFLRFHIRNRISHSPWVILIELWTPRPRAFTLTWPKSMYIYWN